MTEGSLATSVTLFGSAGAHLDRLVPMVEEFCNLDDDELRESCLQAFEAFLRK